LPVVKQFTVFLRKIFRKIDFPPFPAKKKRVLPKDKTHSDGYYEPMGTSAFVSDPGIVSESVSPCIRPLGQSPFFVTHARVIPQMGFDPIHFFAEFDSGSNRFPFL